MAGYRDPMHGTERVRFPRSVYGIGQEPDPRFSLANERTFLAWIRTALACIAGGVAVDAVVLPLPEITRVATSAVLLLLGLGVPPMAWFSWAATERALRLDRPLPASPATPAVALGVLTVAILIGIGSFVR